MHERGARGCFALFLQVRLEVFRPPPLGEGRGGGATAPRRGAAPVSTQRPHARAYRFEVVDGEVRQETITPEYLGREAAAEV